MEEPEPPDAVEAEPTKDFFVSMLVRDIDLPDAIIDLVDNAVDGARRLRGEGPYQGLAVSLRFNGEHFEIFDNAGGIDIDIARRYAFRFGRDEQAPALAHSIGQFGVGMKRTLFKLGRHFFIDSRTVKNSFVLDEHVDDWRNREGWTFRFDRFSEGEERDPADCGTTIVVRDLYPGVAEELALERFERVLVRDIELKHMRAIAQGLTVTVNGTRVTAEPLKLIENEHLVPARWDNVFNGQTPVRVQLFAGVAEASQARGGWYVFCNGRLVVAADQSALTVWGEAAGASIPRFHPEYAEFRGYAFFDCEDAGRLPWTTTKTGVDTDNKLWRATRRQMGLLSKPVVAFLRQADRQGDAAQSAGEEARADLAQNLLRNSSPVALEDVSGASTFVHPVVDFAGLESEYQFIRYRKPRAEYHRACELLGVDSPKEVGERTFDYYLRRVDD